MGDPTKLGAADLGPLLAMMAAGTYPAVSAMVDDEEGKLRDQGIIVPPKERTEEEKKQDNKLTKINNEIVKFVENNK